MRYFIFFLFLPLSAFAQANNIYIDQIGNANTFFIEQKDFGGKSVSVINEGDYNVINILQQGAGHHSATISSATTLNPNNSNNFVINQSGTGDHTANIILHNSSAGVNNNTASITQSGNANKSLTVNMTGSGIGFTGLQDNLNTPDSATISITCLTPPCSGYSYVKN